jgi:hypothetical protein
MSLGIRLPTPGVLAVKALAFGVGAAAIYELGRHELAVWFALIAFANTAAATADRKGRAGTR